MIIYAITNTVNGKRYIGMTSKPLAKRWAAHKTDARCDASTTIAKAIRKHGEVNFRIEVVAHLMPGMPYSELRELERFVISQEGTFSSHGYNRNPGGDGLAPGSVTGRRGTKMPEGQRAKLRAAWARNPDRRALLIAKNKAPVSDETRAKISEANMRPDRVDALRARNAVMNQTPEHKAKLKAAWAGSDVRRAAAAARMIQANDQRRQVNGG